MPTYENLVDLIKGQTDWLVDDWISYFDAPEEKETEARYYDDFLGFFEECLYDNLDIHAESTKALKLFLQKLIQLIGEEEFFHFKESVYTCYLKMPIFNLMNQHNLFTYELVRPMTAFFESLTSHLILETLQSHQKELHAADEELREREAPIAEIDEGVLMVVIVGTLDSNRIMLIIDKILHVMEQSEIDQVIIDISAIDDMNSEIANQLIKLSNAIHFMGARATISGINANIAKRLTHLAIDLGEIRTFRATKDAMAYIRTLKEADV